MLCCVLVGSKCSTAFLQEASSLLHFCRKQEKNPFLASMPATSARWRLLVTPERTVQLDCETHVTTSAHAHLLESHIRYICCCQAWCPIPPFLSFPDRNTEYGLLIPRAATRFDKHPPSQYMLGLSGLGACLLQRKVALHPYQHPHSKTGHSIRYSERVTPSLRPSASHQTSTKRSCIPPLEAFKSLATPRAQTGISKIKDVQLESV